MFSHRTLHRTLAALAASTGLALGLTGLSGCSLSTGQIETAPLSAAEQQMQILEIVPVGTPRDQALERLEAAGIVGGFGTSGAQTTYYCDLWNRRDGSRWHIDVAVLFDEEGRVWIARSGSTTIGPATADSSQF